MRFRTAITMRVAGLLHALAALARPSGAEAVTWGADYFPNVPLVTQDGKTVRFYDDLLKGKVVAIDLIYTHCHYSCPLETARLAQVQRLLDGRVGKDIFFYSISIDPKRDTPEVMKAYAQKFHAGPGWTFLTGKKEDIDLISRKLGLQISGTEQVNRDGHTPDLMIGNVPAGQWMRNSALDNARLLAVTLTRFADGWKRPSTAVRSYAAATQLPVTKGQYLFSTKCAACHTIGYGDRVGPDLSHVTDRRDGSWLARYLAAPDEMLARGDPIARLLHDKYNSVNMPNLGLPTEDVTALIDYLRSEAARLKKETTGRPPTDPLVTRH
jgi:protein SCO1/2